MPTSAGRPPIASAEPAYQATVKVHGGAPQLCNSSNRPLLGLIVLGYPGLWRTRNGTAANFQKLKPSRVSARDEQIPTTASSTSHGPGSIDRGSLLRLRLDHGYDVAQVQLRVAHVKPVPFVTGEHFEALLPIPLALRFQPTDGPTQGL